MDVGQAEAAALPPPSMTAFDAPSREVCTARREPTATPLQALALLNDPQGHRALAAALPRQEGLELCGDDAIGNGTFRDVSSVAGLDFPADGRAFAVLDLDLDGDLDLVLKNRTEPQVRVLRNELSDRGSGLVFELADDETDEVAPGRAEHWIRQANWN